MSQDPLRTSPPSVGTRFRPYASSNHHVTKGRYITSNDPRGYIPVYEYPLNGQWIMMDIDDGYILWTGIWKALGNSKADIVKMIDSQPDLAPLIRRVRGGYLKIQGTWMPYEKLLFEFFRRVAWTIRDDLIPLFGPTFPSTCLSPEQPGYGQVVASGPNRRRARRNTQPSTSMNPPREQHTNWTVVTPHDPGNPRHYQHPSTSSTHNRPVSPDDPASPASTSRNSVRYSPYNSHAPYPTKRSSFDGRRDLSLDIPSLSLRDHAGQPPQSSSRTQEIEHITLPPIRHPADSSQSRSSYALPPISAMEDLRGLHVQDSAAVLRRLKADESSSGETSRRADEWRRRSHSTSQTSRHDGRNGSSSHAAHVSRSYPDHGYRSRSSSQSESENHNYHRNSGLSFSVPSDASHSTCDPSPISPATPRSAASSRDPYGGPANTSVILDKDYERYHGLPVPKMADWTGTHGHDPRASDMGLGSRRHSDTDSEPHPHRPW
ncbi:hypothetical protein C0991_002973 [Blastosporella zonata]|nr:hypothetical protein C0991_002973 [Blastosporella zonata]